MLLLTMSMRVALIATRRRLLWWVAVARSAVRTALTDNTPGSASTADSAAWRKGSSWAPRSGSTSIEKPTLPSLTTRPATIPRETISVPLSGSVTRLSASSTSCSMTSCHA